MKAVPRVPGPMRRADNLTIFVCRFSGNLEASASWNSLALFIFVQGLLYLYYSFETSVTVPPQHPGRPGSPGHSCENLKYCVPQHHLNPWDRIRSRGLQIDFVLMREATGVYCRLGAVSFRFCSCDRP